MSEEKNTEANPAKKAAPKKQPKLAIEITKHRTKVGGVICAVGARLTVDADKAKALESTDLAKIVGV